jgi:hypothetical protein
MMTTKMTKGREYFSYYGTTCIGRIVVDGKTGGAKAFDPAGRSLGEFDGYDAARKAISLAHVEASVRRGATEEALKRLAEPVGFVSGLPDVTSRTVTPRAPLRRKGGA